MYKVFPVALFESSVASLTLCASPPDKVVDGCPSLIQPSPTSYSVCILQRLVDTGNTIIVIEHNLDLIKTCDHIIDLGPEGGDGGGQVVAVGTPEQICKNEQSYTGKFLKKYLSV